MFRRKNRIAVKEPRAFTSSVVNTKPSTCPSGQKWESIHQEQSKTFKLLTETVNLDQENTSKTKKKLTLDTWHSGLEKQNACTKSSSAQPKWHLFCFSPLWTVRLAVAEKYNYANMSNLPAKGTHWLLTNWIQQFDINAKYSYMI